MKLREYFPAKEMKSREHMQQLFDAKSDAYKLDEGPDYTLVYFEKEDFLFIDYILVSSSSRGSGLGSKVMDRVKKKNKAIILEVDPVSADDPESGNAYVSMKSLNSKKPSPFPMYDTIPSQVKGARWISFIGRRIPFRKNGCSRRCSMPTKKCTRSKTGFSMARLRSLRTKCCSSSKQILIAGQNKKQRQRNVRCRFIVHLSSVPTLFNSFPKNCSCVPTEQLLMQKRCAAVFPCSFRSCFLTKQPSQYVSIISSISLMIESLFNLSPL
jgi:hypothetical protein